MRWGLTFVKKEWNVWLGTSILFTLLLVYVFSNRSIQVFHYDMIEQYVRFIERGYDLIRSPGVEWWDFNHFLGASIFSYGYYFLFSPFWLLFAMLPSKELIPSAMLWVNVFKLWILFLSSTYYASKLTSDRLARFIGASIITFGGFTLAYYQYGFYTDALIFLPLVLVGVEQYLKHQKALVLVISVAILACVNLYLFIVFTAYVFLYALFRSLVLNGFSLKIQVKTALRFIGFYSLGLGLSAVLFWPNLSLILSSSRIQSSTQNWLIDFPVLFRYVTSWIMPVVDRNDFNPFIQYQASNSYGYSGGSAVYSLILSPLFLTQVWVLKASREKYLIQVFYGLLFLIALFPPLYFFLQGNSDTRWMLMFILLNAYTLMFLFTHRKEFKASILFITALGIGFVLAGSYILSLRMGFQETRIYFDIAKRNIIVLAIIVGLYLVSVILLKKEKYKTVIYAITIVLEIALILGNIFFNPLKSISMTPKQFDENSVHDLNVINAIKELDNGNYRIEMIQESGYNDPQSKDYMGLTFYSSVYNFEVDSYIQNHLSSAGGWLVGNNTGKWLVKNLLGSKYWVTDMAKPYSVPYGYEAISAVKQDDLTYLVFKNSYAAPMLYTQSETLSYSTWATLSALDKSRAMMQAVVVEDSSQSSMNFNDSVQTLAQFHEEISYTFDQSQKNKVIVVEFPRSEEVTIELFDKGTQVKKFYSYEPQYSSLYSEVDFDTIVVHVTNLWGVPEEEFNNTLSIQDPQLDMDVWYKQITQNPFNLTLGVNQFTASGTAHQDEWVVTSIAYDPDWSVFVNGLKVKVEKVNGGFIGFQVPKGEVTIEAHYFPQALYVGGLISLISGVYCVYWFGFRRRKKTA